MNYVLKTAAALCFAATIWCYAVYPKAALSCGPDGQCDLMVEGIFAGVDHYRFARADVESVGYADHSMRPQAHSHSRRTLRTRQLKRTDTNVQIITTGDPLPSLPFRPHDGDVFYSNAVQALGANGVPLRPHISAQGDLKYYQRWMAGFAIGCVGVGLALRSRSARGAAA
ncbi:MAG: hypothetical protein R3A78_03865 [Polyangiales bacterium]|nr:hypothetical protein [Myxococcales bacterium]